MTSNTPSQVLYSKMNLPSIGGSSRTSTFGASNGSSFVSTSNNEIRIPIAAEGWLDASRGVLSFTVTNDDAAQDMILTNGAGCLFQQLRIESGNVEIERIDDMNVLGVMVESFTSHAREGWTISNGRLYPGSDTATAPNGTNIGQTESASYSINLTCSGFLNNSGRKAIPLLGTQGITLVLTLGSVTTSVQAEAGGTVDSFTVTNPRFVCPVFTVADPGFNELYRSMLGDTGIEFPGVTYKRYINTYTAGAGAKVCQINDRSLSLRGFVTGVRTTADVTDADKDSLSTKMIGITNYVYSIAGDQAPLGGVAYSATNAGPAYQEALSLFQGDSKAACIVDLSQFTTAGTNSPQALGVLCVDTNRWADHNTSFNGINTAASSQPSSLEITGAGGALASTVNTWSVVDAMYRLDSSGIFSVAM